MKVNVNHPSFIQFLEQITNNILSNISILNYFSLSPEKKLALQYIVLKLLKNAVKVRAILTDDDLKSFIVILYKRNEDIENYELAAILNDMSKNFDGLIEKTKVKKRTNKVIKIENKD
jgi:triphosphoribosyl-dephospho-CoA synthetase